MSSIRWEDMVFANRNQSYGAYLLRKAYPGHVTISFAFAMMTVTLILASPTIKAMFEGEHTIIGSDTRRRTIIEILPMPPIEIPKIPQPKVDLAPIKRFVPPRVTDKPVEDDTPTVVDLLTAPVTADISGGDVTFAPAVDVVVPLPDVAEDPNAVVVGVEIAPEFPGGIKEMMKFIGKNIKYPAIARRMETQGLVFVSFVVDKDGTLTSIETIKGISAECNEEAMRVVGKMPKWKPGRQGGKAVRVRFVLPIRFTLGGS